MEPLISRLNDQPRQSTEEITEMTHAHIPISTVASNFFNWLGRTLATWLVPRNEPSVRQITDRKGQVGWRVDDPHTGKTYWFASEAAVRIWLDSDQYR